MLTDELISELNGATDEIFENFKSLSEGIEMVQDTSKVANYKNFTLFLKFIGK